MQTITDDPQSALQNNSGRHPVSRGAGPWKPQHAAPYPRARARGGRINTTHRNRVLKLNAPVGNAQDKDTMSQPTLGNTAGPPSTPETGESISASGSTSWVSKRDRHMQLINTSIYEKDTQLRKKAINETQRQKAQLDGQREKARIAQYLYSANNYLGRPNAIPSATAPAQYETSIDGLRFRVMDGGSKLFRILGNLSNGLGNYPETHTAQMYQAQHSPPQNKLMLAVSCSTVARTAICTDLDSSKPRSKPVSPSQVIRIEKDTV